MDATTTGVHKIRHPYYTSNAASWTQWRDVYRGGREFIYKYLQQFSDREGTADFVKRRSMAYNPAFAKQAVDEVKNSIFQRLTDISRKGGSPTYQKAMIGEEGGVDLVGSSMNCFIGEEILPELLPMSRVGIYVDMPPVAVGSTLAQTKGKRPYLYVYSAEDICSWTCQDNGKFFTNILLRDHYDTYEKDTGLPDGTSSRYRRLWINGNGKVSLQYYDETGEKLNGDFVKTNGVDYIIELDIDRIPFYLSDIGSSLLENVDGYQIALLNLASSDLNYALEANFPFYVEQFDTRTSSEHLRPTSTGTGTNAAAGKQGEVAVGTKKGRRYPKDMDAPSFIHPSAEPLKASMDKQEQMKTEIRQLVNLSLSNVKPQKASAESKGMDNQGLESGLSYIGLELENMERVIAELWAMYEKSDIATVKYPEIYAIKTVEQKLSEAKSLNEMQSAVPSKTFHKAIAKRIADLLVGRDVESSDKDKINAEIDAAKAMNCSIDMIVAAVENGFLDLKLAAELCDFPEGTTDKAANEHADRLARIAESQASANPSPAGGNPAARGVKDLGGNAKGEKKAAYDKTVQDPTPTSKVRGAGK